MAIELTYNSVTVPIQDAWVERTAKVMTAAGRAVKGYRHTLIVQAYFLNGSIADKVTDIDTVVAKFRESAQDITIAEEGTTVRSVTAASVQGTGPWSTFELPAAALRSSANLPVTVTFEYITDPPTGTSGVTVDDFEDTIRLDKQQRRTYTRRGNLSTESGTSAKGKVAQTDPGPSPGSASLPSGTTWELQDNEYTFDKDDLNLSYSWVYIEAHEDLLTTAKEENYSISARAAGGTETWTASGSMGFERGTRPTIDQIRKLLVVKHGWPKRGQIISQDHSIDPRTNTVSFTIVSELGYGTGGTLEYDHSITTLTEAVVADHKAASSRGKDKRQTLARPVVTITQVGRWVKSGAKPLAPAPVMRGDLITHEVRPFQPTPSHDVRGRRAREGVEWRYVMRPLNVTSAGSVRSPVEPSNSHPMQGQTPSKKVV